MRTSEPAWRHLVLCALLASGSAGAQATATAEPAQPFRLSLGSFESTSAKFSAPDLLKVTRQALEALAAEQTPPTFSIVREIGGAAEETAAAWAADNLRDIPKVAFIAGRTAPEGKRMGHAGAIISGGAGTAASKVAALEAAGFRVAESPLELPALLRAAGYRG